MRLRLGKKHGKGCDHDNAAIVKDPIAHGQRANRSNPDLTRFLDQIEQRLSKLRVDTQPSMEFLKCRKERLALGPCPLGQATVAVLVPSRPRDRVLALARQCSLGPRSCFEFRDEVFQPQTSRRLDFADVRQEFLFVERLPRPFEDFGRILSRGNGSVGFD